MCKQCETKAVYEFTNKRKLCGRCFIRYFQKKVLYTIRKFEMVKNGDTIFHQKGSNFKDVVLEDILKMFMEKVCITLVNKKNKKVTKIAVASTLDEGAGEIVYEIIKGDMKKLNVKPIEKKIIKPLYLFLNEEVLLYAGLRKLKFYKINPKENKIGEFINKLEKKHPEIKRAVVNGYLKLLN